MSQTRVLRIQSRICVGGPALNTILLTANLDPARFETKLVGGRLLPEEKPSPLIDKKGVPVTIIEEMGRSVHWWDDIKALWRLIKLIREYKPHIVHTHTAKAGALGRLAAWLCRVPFRVHTFHGHVFHGYFSNTVTRAYIYIERFLAKISHRIVVISPRQKDDLVNVYKVIPDKKCRIVRLGFELAHVASGEPGQFRASLGLSPEIKLAGILARLVPIKNHALLIKAIEVWAQKKDANQRASVRFLIIGDGDLRHDLETQVRDSGLDDIVIFTGWRSDVPEIYADLDLNMLSSKNEGTPVTLIEGLASGVPVLTTDVGGVRDFVDETMGEIVPPDVTPEQLAQKLDLMLNRDVLRLEEQTRQEIRKNYDVSRLVNDIETLYNELPKS